MTPTTASPIPPGIEVPDQVRTRLGTSRFFDGFPDDATTETLFDNLDFQRAVQAYLLALPPVDQAAQRRCTSYGAMWFDLHDGPIVLEAPPG